MTNVAREARFAELKTVCRTRPPLISATELKGSIVKNQSFIYLWSQRPIYKRINIGNAAENQIRVLLREAIDPIRTDFFSCKNVIVSYGLGLYCKN